MQPQAGDRIVISIVIKGHRVGELDRDCEVLEARGLDGGSPFLVRWGDTGHESLVFPGTGHGRIESAADIAPTGESVLLGDIGVRLGAIELALEHHWEELVGSDPAAAAHVSLATRFVHRAVLALSPDTIA